MTRRRFLIAIGAMPIAAGLARKAVAAGSTYPEDKVSAFCRRLRPVGRILEMEGWYVWCQAPIEGPDGKTHVFFSRWPAERGMGGWINRSEIAHAVAEAPEGPYEFVETVLEPRGGGRWDGTTCHNPHIRKVGDLYCLFYMGNANGRTDTKRIGLATARSLAGPWQRPDRPLLEPGAPGSWDDHCTTNPSFVRHPNGQYWLYYKSWNTRDYETGKPPVRGNRKYGLAIADRLEGPYRKHPGNPVIDFSGRGGNRQCEDAFVWREDGRFRVILRDMGIFSHEVGLYMESDDGLTWSEPSIAFLPTRAYFEQPPAPPHLTKYGRFERPQLLLRDGRPAYLFTTTQGGQYATSSGYLFAVA